MYLIKPSVKLEISDNSISHLAKCARICYASEPKDENSDNKLFNRLLNQKHLSMFRHITHYYYISKKEFPKDFKIIYNKLREYKHCPYIGFVVNNGELLVAFNGQFLFEHPKLVNTICNHEVSYDTFYTKAPHLIRITAIITTQISTSRELNRVSPNNIAEQSTRYVNFGKKKGITICLPHWWDDANIFKKLLFKSYWKLCELMYMLLLKLNFKPQDARGVLPLDTATKVAYTYNMEEWKNIINLRYFGITGVPHPNAKIIAGEIYDKLCDIKYISNGLI